MLLVKPLWIVTEAGAHSVHQSFKADFAARALDGVRRGQLPIVVRHLRRVRWCAHETMLFQRFANFLLKIVRCKALIVASPEYTQVLLSYALRVQWTKECPSLVVLNSYELLIGIPRTQRTSSGAGQCALELFQRWNLYFHKNSFHS